MLNEDTNGDPIFQRIYTARQLLRNPIVAPRPQVRRARVVAVPRPFNPLRLRRMLTRDEKKAIVLLRWGSLSNFSVVRLTVKEVSTKLRLAWSTVKTALVAFVRAGFVLDNMGRKY